MKYLICLSIIIIVSGIFYMASPVFASDFDKFAKSTIRDLGHRSDPQLATDAVLNYLIEGKIDDPLRFLSNNMGDPYIIDSNDENISETDREWLGQADRLTSFKKEYFNRGISGYNFRGRVWDFASGDRKITAQIYYSAP